MSRYESVARGLLLIGGAFSLGGCVLPVSYTENASPPLIGEYRRSDGTPVAGRRVMVGNDYRGRACRRIGARAITDSAGRFELPRTTVHHRWILLFPAFEHFWNSYWLCAGDADTAVRVVYEGKSALKTDTPSDTVSCLEWEWEGHVRTTCSAGHEGTLVTGGQWRDADAVGWYRVIVIEGQPPIAYVQWLEGSGAGAPARVRATAELPLGAKVSSLSGAEIRQWQGRWYAELPGTRRTFLDDYAAARFTFELGTPGQLRKVSVP